MGSDTLVWSSRRPADLGPHRRRPPFSTASRATRFDIPGIAVRPDERTATSIRNAAPRIVRSPTSGRSGDRSRTHQPNDATESDHDRLLLSALQRAQLPAPRRDPEDARRRRLPAGRGLRRRSMPTPARCRAQEHSTPRPHDADRPLRPRQLEKDSDRVLRDRRHARHRDHLLPLPPADQRPDSRRLARLRPAARARSASRLATPASASAGTTTTSSSQDRRRRAAADRDLRGRRPTSSGRSTSPG